MEVRRSITSLRGPNPISAEDVVPGIPRHRVRPGKSGNLHSRTSPLIPIKVVRFELHQNDVVFTLGELGT
jgi:hypothetical protein